MMCDVLTAHPVLHSGQDPGFSNSGGATSHTHM